MTDTTVYEQVGGSPWFRALVDRFYDGIESDPVLGPMYPDDVDALAASREHLTGFLIQYWGGPGTYSEQRGHPRLRMRHMPFAIGVRERDAWLARMLAALDADPPPEPALTAIRDYFVRTADFLRNTDPLTLRPS